MRDDEQTAADERARQDAQHDRHCEPWIDVAATEINAGTRGGGHADHEVAGGRGDLERQPHDAIHRQDLEGARADAKQAREQPGDGHEPPGKPDVLGVVRGPAVRDGIGRVHAETRGRGVGGEERAPLATRAHRDDRRVQQEQTEDHRQRGGRDHSCQKSARERAGGRRHLHEHADPDVRVALANVGRGGAGRRGDDGHQRRPDRVPHVDLEQQREHRHDDDPAAEPGQCSDDPGAEGAEPDQKCQLEDVGGHAAVFLRSL